MGKIINFIGLWVILVLMPNVVIADSSHLVIIENTSMESSAINTTNSVGVPLSISLAQIDFSHTSKKWQGGVGFGLFNNRTAISGGVAKKFKDTLIRGSIGIEEGELGGGVGIVFQFN